MNNELEQPIRTGHYRTRASLGNEHATIIRIVGRDEKTGKYKSIDGDLYTESDLRNNYVYLDTRSQLNVNSKPKRPIIMGDIPEYSEENPIKQKTIEQPVPVIKTQPTEQPTEQSKETNNKPQIITKEVIIKTKLEDEILKKCITDAKNYNIIIEDFPIIYNLEQLQMVKQLNLGDFDYIIDKIVEDIMKKDDILKNNIKQFMIQLIENINNVDDVDDNDDTEYPDDDSGYDISDDDFTDVEIIDDEDDNEKDNENFDELNNRINTEKYIEEEILGIEKRLNKK